MLLLIPTAAAGIDVCKQFDVCSGIPHAFPGACFNTPTGYMCACSWGYVWNDVVKLCVDENGCLYSPCNTVQNAVPDSCSDVPAPGYGFNCQCQPGYKWDAATASCVGESTNSGFAVQRCAPCYANGSGAIVLSKLPVSTRLDGMQMQPPHHAFVRWQLFCFHVALLFMRTRCDFRRNSTLASVLFVSCPLLASAHLDAPERCSTALVSCLNSFFALMHKTLEAAGRCVK